MTDEELKKKAEEYSKDHNTVVCCDCSYYDSEEDIEEAYLAGAKELQKENEQLKKDLERANKIIKQYDEYVGNEYFFDENGDMLF